VITRHPLWDEHEEEEDPKGERILDEGRLTFSTTWLDGNTFALSRMPEDTILPLLAALGFMTIFTAGVFRQMWVMLIGLIFSLIIVAIWLWPRVEPKTEGLV
jgi:cytochrome c oxidase subunit 1/cytochrome c oxidase subunit I+III